MFWQGQSTKCISYLASQLTKNSEHPFTLAFYRLWIEVLAELGDRAALSQLSGHLARRQEQEITSLDYFALRGIIHYEQDEWEAVDLLYPSMKDHHNSHYAQEFCAKYLLRTQAEQLKNSPFLQEPLKVDYLQWSLAALCLQIMGANALLEQLLQQATAFFPQAPLAPHFHCHRAIEHGEFAAAKVQAKQLRQSYPHQLTHYIVESYCEIHLQHYKTAVHLLQKAALLPAGKDDPDLSALLSYAFRHLGRNNNAGGWQQARRAQEKAEEAYNRFGISCPSLRIPFQEQETSAQERKDNLVDFAAAKNGSTPWMLAAAPSALIALLSAPLAEIIYRVQALDPRCKGNDLVFISCAHPWEAGNQRILALYLVLGKAGWDYAQGETFNLKLVKRFREPLSVAFPWATMKAGEMVHKGGISSGSEQLYQLNQQQLGMINREIEIILTSKDYLGIRGALG
jgi:hypothetical protein